MAENRKPWKSDPNIFVGPQDDEDDQQAPSDFCAGCGALTGSGLCDHCQEPQRADMAEAQFRQTQSGIGLGVCPDCGVDTDAVGALCATCLWRRRIDC